MKIYTTDGKIITERPKIQIGDKLYMVDDRQSTFTKINKALNENPDDLNAVFELVFGKKEAAEIEKLELSVSGTQNLLIYVFAAIKGCEFEEAEKFFRNEQ